MTNDINEKTILRLSQELVTALDERDLYKFLYAQEQKRTADLLCELEELKHPEFYKDNGGGE